MEVVVETNSFPCNRCERCKGTITERHYETQVWDGPILKVLGRFTAECDGCTYRGAGFLADRYPQVQ